MKSYFIILLYMFGTSSLAQNPAEVDSLKMVLHDQKQDTNRVNTLLQLVVAEQYIWEKSHPLLDEALELSREIGFWSGEAKVLSTYAYTVNKFNDPINAIHYYDSAYAIYEKHKDEIGMARARFGKAYLFDKMGNVDKAFSEYLECLKVFERQDYKRGISSAYINMGNILHNKGETEKAMSYMHKSVALAKELGNLKTEGICYSNLGNQHRSLGQSDSALFYYRASLYIKEITFDIRGVAAAYNRLGYYWEDHGQFDSTQIYYDQALKIFIDVKEDDKISMMRSNIGELYIKKGKYKKALSSCKEALKLGEEISAVVRQKEACHCIAKAYGEMGDGRNAMDYFIKYDGLKDSILDDDKKEAILKSELSYEFDKQLYADSISRSKEDAIFQLKIEQERKEQKAQIAQQRNLAILGGIGFVLMIGLAFVLYRSNRQKQKSNEEIQMQKLLVEEKNQEILDSITYAKRIQSAILPTDKLVKEYLDDSFVLYLPKDIVAGDFYWMEPQKDRVLFAAADCTGHGVPGAMVSVICNNGMNRAVREYGLTDPAKILDKTREIVIQEFAKSEEEVKDGMDIAFVSLSLGPSSVSGRSLKYAGAHNPLWIIRNDQKEIEEVKADKQPIGQYLNAQPFTQHEIKLNPGDTFYIFSDGFADQFGGEKGKKFKASNFKSLLLSIQNENLNKQRELILNTFEDWKGSLEQLDDVCVIGVRV